nr:hypothetical protein [Tanacetum cinerariifolium]
VIIIPLIDDLIVASSIGNLSYIRKRHTHEVVKGRPAKNPLEVLCLLLLSTSSCSEEPITGGGFPPESDGPELVRNSSRISARIWGSNVCKAF